MTTSGNNGGRWGGWAGLCYLAFLVACTPTQKENIPVPVNEDTAETALYRIGKGDILEIITWKEPDFSREVTVRLDGRIGFPLLDDIPAAGRTSAEIRDELREKLKTYVTYPVVSVVVKASTSQKYYLIGEIAKPGEYPLVKELSVLQSIALAGGFTEWASPGGITLIRREGDVQSRVSIDYHLIIDGQALDQNLMLQADDIVVIP